MKRKKLERKEWDRENADSYKGQEEAFGQKVFK
jgi:hypothetical protein